MIAAAVHLSDLIAEQHASAVTTVLALPVVLTALLFSAAFLSARGWALPAAWLDRLGRTPRSSRILALLILLDASLHVGLVPAHFAGDPALAGLFAIDALALLGLGVWISAAEGWEPPAIVLLMANVVAYVWFVDTGREVADAVGLGCKVLEVTALVAVIVHTIGWSERVALVRSEP